MRPVVIVPTYNERANIAVLVPALLAIDGLQVLIVDDGSPDGTGAEADGLARTSRGRVRVIHRTGRRGYGRSHLEGMRAALQTDATHICQMDADLSHDPADLRRMLEAARTGGPDHRVPLRGGRPRDQLAAPAARAERVRELVRARHHRRGHFGLHQRLPVLEPAAAGVAGSRRRALGRVRLSGGAGVEGTAGGRPHPGGADHVRRTARRRVEAVVARDRRESCSSPGGSSRGGTGARSPEPGARSRDIFPRSRARSPARRSPRSSPATTTSAPSPRWCARRRSSWRC